MNIKKIFRCLMPETHQKQIDEIHARVENELIVTEKKIQKLNAFLRDEAVADLLIKTLKEKNARR